MKIAVASDEKCHLTEVVIQELRRRKHEVFLIGPLADNPLPWPQASLQLAEMVATKVADEGVLFCWTGTGASIAANKVPGIRAALVGDAQNARGARWWNDANVLVLGLRATSEAIALEILEAWFAESVRASELECINQLRAIEEKYAK